MNLGRTLLLSLIFLFAVVTGYVYYSGSQWSDFAIQSVSDQGPNVSRPNRPSARSQVAAVGPGGIDTITGKWVPPIGVPIPPFGVKETAPAVPSPWTANTNGFYYVRTGGNNSGNGYPGSPRNMVPATIPAGSVVIIDGTYNGDHGDNIVLRLATASSASCLYYVL